MSGDVPGNSRFCPGTPQGGRGEREGEGGRGREREGEEGGGISRVVYMKYFPKLSWSWACILHVVSVFDQLL